MLCKREKAQNKTDFSVAKLNEYPCDELCVFARTAVFIYGELLAVRSDAVAAVIGQFFNLRGKIHTVIL